MHSVEALINIAVKAKSLRDYLQTQVGDTDDFPCEICFNTTEEARQYLRILDDLDLAIETLDRMIH